MTNIDYTQTIVHLPGRISATRTPWTGTIGELIADATDHALEKARHDAADLGLIDADRIGSDDTEVFEAESDRFEGLLPELLATNLEALRRFADDPNAEVRQ